MYYFFRDNDQSFLIVERLKTGNRDISLRNGHRSFCSLSKSRVKDNWIQICKISYLFYYLFSENVTLQFTVFFKCLLNQLVLTKKLQLFQLKTFLLFAIMRNNYSSLLLKKSLFCFSHFFCICPGLKRQIYGSTKSSEVIPSINAELRSHLL